MFDALTNSLLYAIDFLQTYNGAVTAAATVAIGAFNFFLVWVTNRQAHLTLDSINLARKEFTATQRLKLVIREAHLFRITPMNPTLGARFVVANSGAGAAEVVESHIQLEFNENVILLPLQPIDGANALGSIKIEAGESVVKECGSSIGWAQYTNEENRQMNAREKTYTKLWFRSFVVYVDQNKLRRRTAFCRGYDAGARRFRIEDDPDYEYADWRLLP
jgi:hypothetical protein